MSQYADQLTEQTLPPQRGTKLITSPTTRQVFTDVRETDARTALTRGLAEYLETLSIEWVGGRHSRFVNVLQTWAEPEVVGVFPSAVVYSEESGSYEDSTLTSKLTEVPNTEPRRYLRQIAEVRLNIAVEVWATDPVERMALAAMLEDALDPNEWMSGLRLCLPHYHNSHATYEKLSMSYEDSLDGAQKRWRKAVFAITGQLTQLRRVGVLPRLDLRLGVATGDDQVIVSSVVGSDVRMVVVYQPGPVGMSGRDGATGATGASGAAGFTHVQAVPAFVWTINHNLGFNPTIEIFDTFGREIEADVLNVTVNQATITFLSLTAGSARCV